MKLITKEGIITVEGAIGTGLTDCKGIEIFEGDTLLDRIHNIHYTVEWLEGAAMFVVVACNEAFGTETMDMWERQYWEVVDGLELNARLEPHI